MEKLSLDKMRADAQVQIAKQKEENWERFSSFVDELESHDSTKAFEGLAEIQRADNLAKMVKFSLQSKITSGEIKIKE